MEERTKSEFSHNVDHKSIELFSAISYNSIYTNTKHCIQNKLSVKINTPWLIIHAIHTHGEHEQLKTSNVFPK